MHAGNLPGYPASAGCVRLPVDFAADLYSVTAIGTTVIIADNRSAPKETVKPGLLFSSNTGTAARAFKWTPEKAPKGPVSDHHQRGGSRRLCVPEWCRNRQDTGQRRGTIVRLVRLYRVEVV